MRQVSGPGAPPKLKGVLDPLEDVVRQDNQLLALAVGGALSAVVVRAVEDLTDVLSEWLGGSTLLAPITEKLHVSLLGGKLDIPRIIGVVFYIVLSIVVLAALVFGILGPLIGGKPKRRKRDD